MYPGRPVENLFVVIEFEQDRVLTLATALRLESFTVTGHHTTMKG
jgi:hypothetical protein